MSEDIYRKVVEKRTIVFTIHRGWQIGQDTGRGNGKIATESS